jgi:hypothetical protein
MIVSIVTSAQISVGNNLLPDDKVTNDMLLHYNFSAV